MQSVSYTHLDVYKRQVFNLCIGNITPPVGKTLFVGVKVGNLKIEDVMGELIKYYAVIILVLMLVTYLPQLSMYLPIDVYKRQSSCKRGINC